jgi:HSP20 family molecular chaperone IbpA
MRDWLDFMEGTLLDILAKNYLKYQPIQVKDNKYVLTLELPGIKEKDIKLTFRNFNVILTAPNGLNNYLYIGEDVDEDNITATLEDGILTVILPKKPISQGKTIKITRP